MAFDPITEGINLASTVLNKFFPDADTKLKGELTQAANEINNQHQLELAQLQANVEQAKHPSIFVAGARPAAMWVGVITLLYNGIGMSLLSWVALCFGLPVPPVIPDTGAVTALFALLGIGGLRTYDKVKGIDTKKVGK
jgi:hypothetical protein